MSALAKYLKNLSFSISGSDERASDTTRELELLGIKIFIGHNKNNVIGCDVFIYSSAIGEDNEEYRYAVENGLALYSRAELLSLISKRFKKTIGICGAHGKTTVCALIAHIMRAANLSFTAFIGGYDKILSNTCNFGNDYFLAEICEYKKNIDHFNCDYSVFLNIDDDHRECYQSFDDLVGTFKGFFDRSRERIIFGDDINLKNFYGNKTIVSINKGDVYAKKYCEKNGKLYVRVCIRNKKTFSVNVDLSGEYNVINVLFAVCVAKKLNISNVNIKKGLNSFKGVIRRDEKIGRIGKSIVYADYAHHPQEIIRSIDRYNERFNKNVCYVFQPHTYSRTKNLFKDFVKCFNDVKDVLIFKTYPAREKYDSEGDAKKLAYSILNAEYYSDYSALFKKIKKISAKKKGIVILGAGDLYDMIKSDLNKKPLV